MNANDFLDFILGIMSIVLVVSLCLKSAFRQGVEAGSKIRIFTEVEDEETDKETIKDKENIKHERNDWNNDRSICSGCNDL